MRFLRFVFPTIFVLLVACGDAGVPEEVTKKTVRELSLTELSEGVRKFPDLIEETGKNQENREVRRLKEQKTLYREELASREDFISRADLVVEIVFLRLMRANHRPCGGIIYPRALGSCTEFWTIPTQKGSERCAEHLYKPNAEVVLVLELIKEGYWPTTEEDLEEDLEEEDWCSGWRKKTPQKCTTPTTIATLPLKSYLLARPLGEIRRAGFFFFGKMDKNSLTLHGRYCKLNYGAVRFVGFANKRS